MKMYKVWYWYLSNYYHYTIIISSAKTHYLPTRFIFQSTDEQDISFSRLSMEDRDCSNTDASQASTASKIKHQPSTKKGEQEANDNDKPEDISKQDTEKAEITVVLETTSTTSEVWGCAVYKQNW